jgi:hypothetical protein
MIDSARRSDLFRRIHRQRSSPMRFGIAVIALPRLDEKSLSRTFVSFTSQAPSSTRLCTS